MKNSEIRKLVSDYQEIKNKFKKTPNNKLEEKLKGIKHRYFHETGSNLE